MDNTQFTVRFTDSALASLRASLDQWPDLPREAFEAIACECTERVYKRFPKALHMLSDD